MKKETTIIKHLYILPCITAIEIDRDIALRLQTAHETGTPPTEPEGWASQQNQNNDINNSPWVNNNNNNDNYSPWQK
ncbi:MAG: hypothetical protein LBN23_05165 [Paludibacter sp.]|jgi:hypothetical protein|nr:hypothetical protein [Paludibacter sp.]